MRTIFYWWTWINQDNSQIKTPKPGTSSKDLHRWFAGQPVALLGVITAVMKHYGKAIWGESVYLANTSVLLFIRKRDQDRNLCGVGNYRKSLMHKDKHTKWRWCSKHVCSLLKPQKRCEINMGWNYSVTYQLSWPLYFWIVAQSFHIWMTTCLT